MLHRTSQAASSPGALICFAVTRASELEPGDEAAPQV
jgi:hypothetical protein